MVIDFGSGDVEVRPCVKAIVIYEQEFGGDMVADLFGQETVRIPEDESGVLFSFDYRQFQWSSFPRVLWACAKAADASFPAFGEWVDSLDDVNLMTVAAEFVPAVRDALFHASPQEAESEEEDKGGE